MVAGVSSNGYTQRIIEGEPLGTFYTYEFAGYKDGKSTYYMRDENTGERTGEVTKLVMPATSNVLQYYTEDGTKVSIRPSGTEPKIKFYIEVHDTLDKKENYDAKNDWADAKIDRICESLGIA